MANLIKTQNGLLFYDDFSDKSLMWTLSPSDAICLSFGDKGLQMIHNEKYCTYTIVEPSIDEYSCVVKLDHIPFNTDDIAGIIILSSNKEYAECQTYLATGPSEITNSLQLENEIKNLINVAIAQSNIVQWTENDEDLPDITPGSSSTGSSSSSSTGTSGIIVGNYIDTLYKYIKFNKINNRYIFYASPDNKNWIEVGNTCFNDSAVIGFFIYGTENQDIIDNTHCYFNEFTLFSSKYLIISGIDHIYDLEIIDGGNNIILRTDMANYQHMVSWYNKKCLINTTTLPTPIINAKVRIYDKNDYSVTIAQFDLGDKIYGGDTFTIENDIRLYINNQEIDQTKLYDLGTFYHGSYYIRVEVHNHEDYIVGNVKIKVVKYSEYYGGEEPVGVALYSEDQLEDELDYKKEIIIDEIKPSEGRTIFMKLIDRPIQDFYKTANSYRFKIIVE